MDDETIKKKLAILGEFRKQKEKDRAMTSGALQAIHVMKLNSQAEAQIKLLEMMLQQSIWMEDNIISLWEEQLNSELKLNQLGRNQDQIKKKIDWFENNK